MSSVVRSPPASARKSAAVKPMVFEIMNSLKTLNSCVGKLEGEPEGADVGNGWTVVGGTVVGTGVTGSIVVGSSVVGRNVVGSSVVGSSVVGCNVVG
jgi:hypothetical protein